MPVQEVSGTYNAKEPISASNPLPVMAVADGAYTNYEDVSQANPQPVAIIADSGAYTRYEDYSDTNAFPVKFIEGQSYDSRFDVSETNPWPVVVVSGGAEAYTIGAVHFDGATELVNASLATASDNGSFSMSFWAKYQTGATGALWCNDAAGASSLQSISGDYWITRFFDAISSVRLDFGAPLADLYSWNHYLVSIETNLANGNKRFKIYITDVVGTALGGETTPYADISDPANELITLFDNLSFYLGSDGFGTFITADVADVWIAPNVSLLDVGGDIPEATRRKFIDAEGKPVDLGANGELPTGAAPPIFFHRDSAAAALTFANNLGIGGSFTTTGTLTNAATSPSD